ncbi:MAG: hypothetical protein QGG36_33315, partial [Pirellulaceae bacterium]|nr:hypothetical protein [Pirellulaceae bacterium]
LIRAIGVSGLFAIPAVLMPLPWMAAIHEWLGLGEFPEAAIVGYLARSLSAFYAIISALLLYVSRDIRYYRDYLRFWTLTVIVTGPALLGIGVAAGLPWYWLASEGPPTLAAGVWLWWLAGRVERVSSPTTSIDHVS